MADTNDPLNVHKKRWLRCFVLHALISMVFWIFIGCNVSSFPLLSQGTVVTTLSQKVLRFLGFIGSQMIFLLAVGAVTHPEDKDAASPADIFFGFIRIAWTAAVGGSFDRDSTQNAAFLARKLQTSRDRALFVFMCAISGSLAVTSFRLSSNPSSSLMDDAYRGAALGVLYSSYHLFKKRIILTFPVIQRPEFFYFKLGFMEMVRTALKFALASVPFAELAVFIVNSSSVVTDSPVAESSMLMLELDFMTFAFLTVTLWEVCHHLVQVLLTKRHRFAPPYGSTAAETSPSDIILSALEETEKSSLVHYLAVLDLCTLSENNVDRWRLCALFEESGETYQRVISECLKPLDMLTIKLLKGLDGSLETQDQDFLKQQMLGPGHNSSLSTQQIFEDYQLCCWCARSVAAITAFSKNNDRYGVAQLRGCNGAVVSSLLSCLLVIEVYLGRRSSGQGGQTAGVNSIKWTVPSRSIPMDSMKKQRIPFRKKSDLHKKAYAMADVLRTSLYLIVGTFKKEMLLSGPTQGGAVIAERDWLGKGQPLYGTQELHVQNLRLFLDFRI